MNAGGDRLSACRHRWGIDVRRRLSGGHRSDVFDCVTARGKAAVLKLNARPGKSETEAAALRAWQQSGAAVRVLDADAELGALLLERLHPGTPLTGASQAAAIDVAADLLARLHAADRAGFRFPALQDSYVDYDRRTRADAEAGAAGVARLPEARAAALRLCATAGRVVLLHGDFLDKNLLWSGSRCVAIDPNPAIGDPCADAGFFAACRQPATGIWERADAVARRIGEDPARALRWAAVWAVGEAAEAWRADSDQLQALMSSPELTRLLAR